MNRRRVGARSADVGDMHGALAGLRALFAERPAPEDPVDSSQGMTAEECKAWQYVQTRVRAGSIADADIACLLACANVDYARNVRRLTHSAIAGSDAAVAGGFLWSEGMPLATRDMVVGHVARVFSCRRDSELLDWLLDHVPVGMWELSSHNQAILALWDVHWSALLRQAVGQDARCRRLTSALAAVLGSCPDPLIWRAYMQRLRQAASGRDVAARRSALVILAQLSPCRERAPKKDRGDIGLNARLRALEGSPLVGKCGVFTPHSRTGLFRRTA